MSIRGELQSFAGPVLFVFAFFALAYAIGRIFSPHSQPPSDAIGYLLLAQPCDDTPQPKWLALKAYGPNREDKGAEITDAVAEYSPRVCSVGFATPTSAVESSQRTQSVVSTEHSIYAQTPPSDIIAYILLTQACRTRRRYDQARWLAIKAYEANTENQGDTFGSDVLAYWEQICPPGNATPDEAVANSGLVP